MDESEVYLQSIIDAFNWASRLLWPENVKPSEFIKIAIELQRLRRIKAPIRFGDDWPMQPTTFPLFMRAGFSALDVANKFRQSIDSCIQVAKVESVGMPRDYNALSDESKSKWMQSAFLRIAGVCTDTTPVERFRERGLLGAKIDCEIMAWKQKKAEKSLGNDDKPPTDNDEIPDEHKTAAITLKQRATALYRNMDWSIDHKRRILTSAIEDGTVKAIKISDRRWIFDKRDG